MILAFCLLAVGVLVLIGGAHLLVGGASSIARKWGVPSFFIGLTVVSMGTSTPELVVNINAAFSGKSDIALGNIIGSNIANILLILGVSAVICPLIVKKNTVWKEIPFGLLAVVMLGIMAVVGNSVGRVDGFVLLAFAVIFTWYVFSISGEKEKTKEEVAVYSGLVSVLMILVGLVGLVWGGDLVVRNAIYLARAFNVSGALIGLTIISIGTSLPELVTSVLAVLKGDNDIAVGNVVGSNIFNVFFILGLTAAISPLSVPGFVMTDIAVVVGSTILLFLFMFLGRHKYVVNRLEGAIFLVLYAGYLGYLIQRG